MCLINVVIGEGPVVTAQSSICPLFVTGMQSYLLNAINSATPVQRYAAIHCNGMLPIFGDHPREGFGQLRNNLPIDIGSYDPIDSHSSK
jgi:hypothetical protein